MIELQSGDVLWSGLEGGSRGVAFHLVCDSPRDIKRSNYGCWCPEEAVEFLRYLGVNVQESDTYSSGYSANGCTWYARQMDLSPHIEEAYDFFRNAGNKMYKHTLKKFDD